MQGEDIEAQMMFWEKTNDVMLRCGHAPADFCGFMVDKENANQKAVRQVFNNGNVMEGCKQSCLFH